jgi:formylglycine-generating enzyme required for sulfatase activity
MRAASWSYLEAAADAAPPVVLVPGGAFLMGSEAGRPDERPVHEVVVDSFGLGRTPVTNAQYQPFVRETGAKEPPHAHEPAFGAADQPVVGVTWHEAQAFAAWLGERYGGIWRLPSEAEWERAVRGGLTAAPTAWGDKLPPGEIPEGPLEGPWLAGRGTPNGFGVCDPGTIVHEWCLDVYAPYPGGEGDPRPGEDGAHPLRRSSRGGSWRHRQRWSPPSARSSLPPDFRYADYGFRVLKETEG